MNGWAEMKFRISLRSLLMSISVGFAADVPASIDSEAVSREKLFQRFLAELDVNRISTNHDENFTNMMRRLFDGYVVHPSFGLRWDEVPAPTLTGANPMVAVHGFISTNGWNMETNGLRVVDDSDRLRPIRGLPWAAITDREFRAVTHKGVLYVLLKGWHHNLSGIAYNPNTNAFAPHICGFKPIGQHWYVWAQPEDPITLPQTYEGQKSTEGGPANGCQPIRSETNRESSAAGSRR